MQALRVKHLNIYPATNTNTPLVQDISFSITKGQTLALMGASGSGKSLTSMALINALPPNIAYNFRQLDFTNSKPALIMQNPGDCFDLLYTIEQTFYESLINYKNSNNVQQHMFELLAEVGLEANIAKRYPFELSGGMLHKVMIALALAKVKYDNATCIIADEPIAGLDCTAKVSLLHHIKNLQKKYNFGLLYIDHDLACAKLMADELAIMHKGQIVEYGKMQDVLNNPQHDYTKALLKTFEECNTLNASHINEHKGQCLLSCNKVEKSYKRKHENTVLKNINFELLEGENLGIVGHNGAGKSTLLRLLLNLENPTNGQIKILGKNITELNNNTWRKSIQAVFQHARLAVNPRMNGHDILMEPLRAHGLKDKHIEKQEVERLLNLVKLPAKYSRAYPQQMSGGQLQRLCIARALALKPKILLLDEPLTDLDTVIAQDITHMLEDIKQNLNLTLLYISHDIRSVLQLCERVLVLEQGQIVDDFSSVQYQSPQRHPAFTKLIQASPWHDSWQNCS